MARGLALAAVLLVSGLLLAPDAMAGHDRGHKGRKPEKRHAQVTATRDARGPSHAKLVYRPARRPVHVVSRSYCGPAPVRVVRRTVHHDDCRHTHGWWTSAPRIYVEKNPYYLNASLGFYVDGAAVQFELGNRPPDGYLWYDPYCGHTFRTASSYRTHCQRHDHPRAVSLAYLEYE